MGLATRTATSKPRSRRSRRPALEAAAGLLALDDRLQDGAHFAQFENLVKTGRLWRARITIVFSAFGRLATVWSDPELPPVGAAAIDRVHAVLSDAGFQPVPREALDAPYTGTHVHAAPIRTWMHRYFDWTG